MKASNSSPSPRRTSGSRYRVERVPGLDSWQLLDERRSIWVGTIFRVGDARQICRLLNTSPDRGRRKAKA